MRNAFILITCKRRRKKEKQSVPFGGGIRDEPADMAQPTPTATFTIQPPEQECSQKGDSGCASEKLGVPHLLSD